MQELLEIEALAQQLRRALTGREISGLAETFPGAFRRHLANVAGPDLSEYVRGRTLHWVQRRGLTLLFVFGTGFTPYRWSALLWQLGPSGWIVPANAEAVRSGGAPLPQANANFRSEEMPSLFELSFADGQRWAYRDQRRWGRVSLWRYAEVVQGVVPALAVLGPDWLADAVGAERALRDVDPMSRRAVKDVLLDQSVASGLGNVLACEILFAAKLHPRTAWHSLREGRRAEVAEIARKAVQCDDPARFELNVYGREGDWCLRSDCTDTICVLTDSTHSTRRSFFCPCCQRAAGDAH